MSLTIIEDMGRKLTPIANNLTLQQKISLRNTIQTSGYKVIGEYTNITKNNFFIIEPLNAPPKPLTIEERIAKLETDLATAKTEITNLKTQIPSPK